MAKQRTIRNNDEHILTAAAQVIDLSKPIYGNTGVRKFNQEWQARSWQMADEIGEVSNAMSYMGDSFSQLRMFIGCNVENELVELTPDEIPKEVADVISPEQVLQAQDTLDALNYPHGLPEIQRMFGMGLFQVGETYLMGRTNEDGEEEWDAYSTEQIFVNTENKYAIKSDPSDMQGEALGEDDFMLRLWRRDPRWSKMSTSSIKAALMILEELLLLTLEVRAVISSRIPAGILIFPDSMELVQSDNTSGDSGQNGSASDLLKTIEKHITTAITTPGSAAAAAPIMMRAHPDDIAKVLEVKFGRDLSENALAHRRELIERFAAAINLPGEILMGKGGLNHWSAWLIDTEALNNHIQPMAKVMTYGLTHQYLLPRLSMDPNGELVEHVPPFVIGFEMAEKLEDPEQTKTEMWAYGEGLISMDAMRKRIDIKDEEAPTPEEYAQRMANKQPIAAPGGDGKAPPADPNLIASAGKPVKKLQLAKFERELRIRLQVGADAAMSRALEKAGAKLRSLAQRDKVAKEQIAASNVPNEMLVATFPQILLALHQTPDALLAGAFQQYGDYWDQTTAAAQKQFLDTISPGLSNAQVKAAQQRYDTARGAARVAIVAGLTKLATDLLYDPNPDAPDQGEFEPSMRVPASLIRNSLILAGGGAILISARRSNLNIHDVPESGLFSSPISTDVLAQSTKLTVEPGFVWVYGDTPENRMFVPHNELDGQTFINWDDTDVLGVGDDTWVDADNGCFHPGDHDGCQCDFDSNITENEGGGDEG